VAKLAEIFRAHDGFLISSPEYNNGYPGLLKNMLDWLSRPGVGGPALSLFANKPAAVMAASPGKFGGVRMLPLLRQYLNVLQMLVIPQVYGLSLAEEAFAEDGSLKDSKAAAAVKALGERVAKLATMLGQA
jgi:NAD(P)H-dependent FMN reductase